MNASRQWLVLIAVTILAAAGVVTWSLLGGSAHRIDPVEGAGAGGSASAESVSRVESSEGSDRVEPDDRAAGLVPDSPTSARERVEVVYERSTQFLEDFWGPHWPELRSYLEKERPERLERYESLVLTPDLVPPPLESITSEVRRLALERFDSDSWRQTRAWLEEASRWPDEPGRMFLQQRLEIGTQDTPEAVLEAVAEANRLLEVELELARYEFFHLARAALELELRAGGYRAWPLVMAGPGIDARHGGMAEEEGRGRNLVSIGLSLNGLWLVRTFVWSEDYPEVERSRFRLAELGKARKKELRKIIVEAD